MNTSLHVNAIISDDVAAVEINGVGLDGFLDRDRTATGWAKRHPNDEVNPEIAYNLAMSRALQQLANEYGRNAAIIAGFPVTIGLGVEAEEAPGLEAAILHYPEAITAGSTPEEVQY